MALWASGDAAAATGGKNSHAWRADGVSIDTRTIATGDLFVALAAARDGHEFVAMAAEKGAAAALVTHRPADVPDDFPLLIVDDVLAALVALGRAARARCAGQIIAVTGSVGKTSTKEMLRHVFSGLGRTHASVASYNNHWGVPLTLARMPANTEFGVFEIGMNHPGEIGPLSQMVRPHVGMITTVAPAHIEAFDGIDGIAAEKGAVFEGLLPQGVAIIPADLDTSSILVDAARHAGATMLGFGKKAEAFRLVETRLSDTTTIAQAAIRGAPVLFKINAAGTHFAMNGLGVLAVAEAVGVDPLIAARELGGWQPPAGRGKRQFIPFDAQVSPSGFDLIDDAYNANPTSMRASFEVLAAAKTEGRKIAVLGDMRELGKSSADYHASLAEDANLAKIDIIHCVGPEMRVLYDALPLTQRGQFAKTVKDLLPILPQLVTEGDVLLIKASNGVGLGQVVDGLKKLGQARPDKKKDDT